MIDDSKLGDRTICFESIGFNVAAWQASSARRLYSRHLLFSPYPSSLSPRLPSIAGIPSIFINWSQLPITLNNRKIPTITPVVFGAYPCQSHHCSCDLDP